jgi:hypothetical protein
MPTAARTEALNAIPLSRFGDVEEIADAAVFLATNRYANNCVLNLDGGLSAVWYIFDFYALWRNEVNEWGKWDPNYAHVIL